MLPAGHTARAPRIEDAHDLYALVRDYTIAVTGSADYTLDDAHEELTEPGVDLEQDARFVHDEAGRLVGNGFVHRKGDAVHVDVVALDDDVRRWLVGWVLDQAREGTVDHGCYRTDEPLRKTLSEHGFQIATTFHRMRIDHAGPVAVPVLPDGVVLRVASDDLVRRAAHHVLMTAFTDHFGFAHRGYEDWLELHERQPGFDWSQMWVAELDGSPVAVLECNDRFADEERCGYVAEVGVLDTARGRGIAKFLLRHAFVTDAAAGRVGTMLHVDTDNVTPALGLYLSVGMRPVLVIDAWRTVLA